MKVQRIKFYFLFFIFTFTLYTISAQQKYTIDTVENLRGLAYDGDSNNWYNSIIEKYEKNFKPLYSVSFIFESKFQMYKGDIIFITSDTSVIYIRIDSNKIQLSKTIVKSEFSQEKLKCMKVMLEKKEDTDCLIYLTNITDNQQKFKHLYFVNHNYIHDNVFSYYMRSLVVDSVETKIRALNKAKYFDNFYSFYIALLRIVSVSEK